MFHYILIQSFLVQFLVQTRTAKRFTSLSGIILIARVAPHRASVVDFSCQLHDRSTDRPVGR